MLEIREFKVEDAVEVSRLMYDSFKTFLGDRMGDEAPQPPEFYIKTGSNRTEWYHDQAFTALDDGKIIGYISASVDLKSKLGSLCSIGVDPNCMAHGVGTALFQAAWKFWMERDVNKIYTCTSSINTRAQRYYARMGFVEEGRRKNHFFAGVDEISLSIFPKRQQSKKIPSVSCRGMRADETSAVAALLASCQLEKWSEEWLEDFRTSSDPIFSHWVLVAEDMEKPGRLVGAMAYNFMAKYRFADCIFLCVDPAERQQGLGTALLNKVVADCSSAAPLRKLACSIPADRIAGVPFMLHRGFVVEEALSEQAAPEIAELRLARFLE